MGKSQKNADGRINKENDTKEQMGAEFQEQEPVRVRGMQMKKDPFEAVRKLAIVMTVACCLEILTVGVVVYDKASAGAIHLPFITPPVDSKPPIGTEPSTEGTESSNGEGDGYELKVDYSATFDPSEPEKYVCYISYMPGADGGRHEIAIVWNCEQLDMDQYAQTALNVTKSEDGRSALVVLEMEPYQTVELTYYRSGENAQSFLTKEQLMQEISVTDRTQLKLNQD